MPWEEVRKAERCVFRATLRISVSRICLVCPIGRRFTLMRRKATLPAFLLLLLLVAGQMSAELCRAQCEGMAMTEPVCQMHGMAHCHNPSCQHASVNAASTAVSAPETCSGQICQNVLAFPQNRLHQEIKTLAAVVAPDIPALLTLERRPLARFRASRSAQSIPPFDPLISSLRI